jgi:hypothetical protein
MHRPLDPRKCSVAIDGNSLDRPDATRAMAVTRLLALFDAGKINLIVPKGVRKEIEHPRTPVEKKETGLSKIFTLPVELNSEEQELHRRITEELRGNAQPGRHDADADHLFEAAKYSGYFITHDQRILDKSSKLRGLLPPSLNVMTLVEFLEIFDDYEAGRRV